MTEFASHDRASRDPGSTAHAATSRTATTRASSTALALQRSAGNRAVSGEITRYQQRQAVDAGGTSSRTTDGSAVAGAADPRLASLRHEAQRLSGVVDMDLAKRQDLHDLNEDQWIVSAIAEFVGRSGDLPSSTAWLPAQVWIAAVRALADQGDVIGAARALARAATETAAAHRALRDYQDATISGAETSTTALEVTAAAGAVAATIATGGAAAAAGTGLLGTSVAVGAGAGLYGMVQEGAGEGGQMLAGTRKAGDFDLEALLVRGGRDAAVGFVGYLAGGALSEWVVGYLGRAAMAEMQPAQLAAIARALGVDTAALTPRMFVGATQRFIVDFLSGAATTPLTTAVQVTIGQLAGEPMPSAADFARLVVRNAVQGGIVQLLVGGLTHGWTSAGLPSGFETTGGAGGTREPTPVGSDASFGSPEWHGRHAEIEARLQRTVAENLTPAQKAATTPKKGVVAAGELHVTGRPASEQFVERSGGAGAGSPEAVHVLGGDEVPLRDQLIGEVIPSIPPPGSTKGVDEASPTARERQLARRDEYLADNRAGHEHSGPRSHDAEKQVLDRAAASLATDPTASGELHLMPSHPPCPACTALIHAFAGDHPAVTVILYEYRR